MTAESKSNPSLPGEEVQWWAVFFDGKPQAAYPRKVQADVYASGFSRGAEVRPLSVPEAAMDANATPWPPRDVVAKLIYAAKHLHGTHNCDHDGYEEVSAALAVAVRWLADTSPLSVQRDGERTDRIRAKVAGMLCRGPSLLFAKGPAGGVVCMEAQCDALWVRLPDVLRMFDESSPAPQTEPAEVKVIYDRGGQDQAWAIVEAIRNRTPHRVVELGENESCGHPDCQTPGACPQCRTITIPPDTHCPDCGNGKRFAPGNEHCVDWHTWPAKRYAAKKAPSAPAPGGEPTPTLNGIPFRVDPAIPPGVVVAMQGEKIVGIINNVGTASSVQESVPTTLEKNDAN